MKKTENTKNSIIASTIKLLKLNGNVTVKEISDDANVNIAAINYHFTDKQTLMTMVIRRVLADFRGKIDAVLNQNMQSEADVTSALRQFCDDFYQFSVENAGIMKYVMMPSNKNLLDVCNKYFVSLFSSDSEFTYKIITRMGMLSAGQSQDELKVKYMLLFSSLAMPLMFRLDLSDRTNGKPMFPLTDPSFKEKYVEQLTKLVLN